jgi:hypothetical protein
MSRPTKRAEPTASRRRERFDVSMRLNYVRPAVERVDL